MLQNNVLRRKEIDIFYLFLVQKKIEIFKKINFKEKNELKNKG